MGAKRPPAPAAQLRLFARSGLPAATYWARDGALTDGVALEFRQGVATNLFKTCGWSAECTRIEKIAQRQYDKVDEHR